MGQIKGKWALVTGASRGIGSQAAVGLAGLGCNVIVHGRRLVHTEGILHRVRELGVDAMAVEGEFAESSQIDRMVDRIKGELGGVDILYNNAAVMNPWKEICEISIHEWERLFRINLFAVIQLCNAFVPMMRERGWGRVVNVSSGMERTPHLSPYACSKWALDKYTDDLAAELKDTNVLVNGLDPGWIKTDLGGSQADYELDTVLPGLLVPVLLEPGDPTGRKYKAQDFKYLK